jgi:hypothetical protein
LCNDLFTPLVRLFFRKNILHAAKAAYNGVFLLFQLRLEGGIPLPPRIAARGFDPPLADETLHLRENTLYTRTLIRVHL